MARHYRGTKVPYKLPDGSEIVFDSKQEKLFYEEIIVPNLASGALTDWKFHEVYILLPKIVRFDGKTQRAVKYEADFTLYWKDGAKAIIDVKNGCFADPVAKLKKKLFHYIYPSESLTWWYRNGNKSTGYKWYIWNV